MAEAQGESAEFQSDRGVFRAEYERELGQWLRRRLGYLCIAFTVFQILSVTALTLSAMLYTPAPEESQLPTRVERRAEEAERRAEAGLRSLPGVAPVPLPRPRRFLRWGQAGNVANGAEGRIPTG